MSKTLADIAKELRDNNNKKNKVQLIYAFNGVGKTQLSREFKELISLKSKEEENEELALPRNKILYYNAFTEDLFYWDNDLEFDAEPKLKIQPNSFTDWVLIEQGQDQNIISTFQRYTNNKLTPHFNQEYEHTEKNGTKHTAKAFSEVTFSLESGDDKKSGNIKISKGEESNFVWAVFYSLLEQAISELNIAEPDKRSTEVFNKLEYVFIDDPVSSLDENHLILLAVDLAQLIKLNDSDVKFIITTHNPLFYNVLYNELNNSKNNFEKYRMIKLANGTYNLEKQTNDSPLSYHLYLKSELEKAIKNDQLSKYHFNFLRNILEKTSTFLGYDKWGELLPRNENDKSNPYETRIINISSHSKHSGEEVSFLTEDDKRVLKFLVNEINKKCNFKKPQNEN